MHSHQLLRLATQSSSPVLPAPVAAAAAFSVLHGRGSSGSRCQHLSSPGSRPVGVSAIFESHGRKQQDFGALPLRGSKISQQGLRRVLLGKRQEVRKRPRSRADTEADSLEDLDLEDLDDEGLEHLFETYGEVVREESVPTPSSSEVDDDAESLELAVALAEVANDVKASEIRVLCVKPLVYWTRFFVIATGFSRPQVDAIGQRMQNMAEERFKRTPKGDLKPNAWTLLDFGDVVVHIFYPQERSFYNLEEFYGNATSVELPFESQSQVL